jgi:hypothetical protein
MNRQRGQGGRFAAGGNAAKSDGKYDTDTVQTKTENAIS